MEGGIVVTDVIPEHAVELHKGGNGAYVQRIEPSFLEGTEMAFYFAFVM